MHHRTDRFADVADLLAPRLGVCLSLSRASNSKGTNVDRQDEQPYFTASELAGMFTAAKNWGRWGDDDEAGEGGADR